VRRQTHSAIYTGAIRHRRFAVRPQEFAHPIALAYVDLEELPTLLGGRLVRPRPGPVRFRRGDYLGDPDRPLAEAVRAAVAEHAGPGDEPPPDGPIRLLTQLRTFGHCFNPVSFYYCFDRDERLRALVAEVTNTPWGERRTYVLRQDGPGSAVIAGTFPKAMHVSPFMGMDQAYAWRAAAPGTTASVHIENHEDGRRVFDATLSLHRRPLTARTVAGVTARYPAATLRVLALIYGHAAATWLRGVPVHPHPKAQVSPR
jgi:DUF1365 family protein